MPEYLSPKVLPHTEAADFLQVDSMQKYFQQGEGTLHTQEQSRKTLAKKNNELGDNLP